MLADGKGLAMGVFVDQGIKKLRTIPYPISPAYGRNIFMQEQLPPAFSNSEVATETGLSSSC